MVPKKNSEYSSTALVSMSLNAGVVIPLDKNRMAQNKPQKLDHHPSEPSKTKITPDERFVFPFLT